MTQFLPLDLLYLCALVLCKINTPIAHSVMRELFEYLPRYPGTLVNALSTSHDLTGTFPFPLEEMYLNHVLFLISA